MCTLRDSIQRRIDTAIDQGDARTEEVYTHIRDAHDRDFRTCQCEKYQAEHHGYRVIFDTGGTYLVEVR